MALQVGLLLHGGVLPQGQLVPKNIASLPLKRLQEELMPKISQQKCGLDLVHAKGVVVFPKLVPGESVGCDNFFVFFVPNDPRDL